MALSMPAASEKAPQQDTDSPGRSQILQLPESLPPSRFVDIPGRGRYHYREIANPGKPVVLLVHGMVATGTINWFAAFEALGEHFHIIAPDLRGHGRSMRDKRRFKVRHCADDLAAMLDTLDIDKATAVGYSMGGAVVQHLWDRHPHKLEGAVFAATGYLSAVQRLQTLAKPFMRLMLANSRLVERLMMINNAKALRSVRRTLRRQRLPKTTEQRQQRTIQHVMRSDLRRTSVRVLLETAQEMVHHDMSHMIEDVTVPTAVLATLNDATFSGEHQVEMARRLPHSELFTVEEGHLFCVGETFGDKLVEVVNSVVGRRGRTGHKRSGTRLQAVG